MSFNELSAAKDYFINTKLFSRGIYSSESIVLLNTDIISSDLHTNVLEVFGNYSAKIYLPIIPIDTNIAPKIISQIEQVQPKYSIEDYTIFDAALNLLVLFNSFDSYFKFIKKERINLNNFIVVFQFKRIKDSFLFFECSNNMFFAIT